jgi:hypothetical protein
VTQGTKEQGRGIGGITPRAASWLAWSLWGLALTLTALALSLLALILSHPNTHIYDYWFNNTTIVITATVGAIVASRRPENPVGWLLCLNGLTTSFSHFSSQYAIYALLARPDLLPAGEAFAWINTWILPILIALDVFTFLLFPTGRLPSRRWRWLGWLTVAFVFVGAISGAFTSGPVDGLGPIRNPLGIGGFTSGYKAVLYPMAPFLFAAAALSVFVRLRRATGVERQQIKWFAYAAMVVAITAFLQIITLAVETPVWFERAQFAVFTVAGTATTISIGIAILRYRLYDIDVIINRTLVYGTLTVMLASAYFGCVTATQAIFQTLTGQERLPQVVIVVSTLVIAALFNPLRRRIQSFIDRRFYRSKYDARKTLETFSVKLRDETDLGALSDDLVGVVRESMQPAHVSLWLRPDTASRRSEGREQVS